MKRNILYLILPLMSLFGEDSLCDDGCSPPIPSCSMGDSGWSISGDFLYWKTYMDQLNYAVLSLGDTARIDSTVHQLDFEMDAGFRISAGYRIPCYQWELSASWLQFNPSAKDSVTVGTNLGFVIPLFIEGLGGDEIFGISANAAWDLKHNMFDLDCSRAFQVSRYILLKPLFGVKGGWINQKLIAEYQTLSSVLNGPIPDETFDIKSDFWGVGPKIGVEARWEAFEYLSLFSNFYGALLWGHFNTTTLLTGFFTLNNDFGINTLSYEGGRARPMIQMQLGLTSRIPFNCEKHWFYILAAYEGQYWWNQNQNVVFGDVNFFNGDLSFQGLTLRSGFDF